MRDIQISRPVLIALVGAVLVGGFLLFKGGSDPVAPPPAPVETASATGSTGASSGTTKPVKDSGATSATGATGETETAAEKSERVAKERRARLVKAAKESGMPLPVYEAIHDGKVVIIYFYTPKGQDDQLVSVNLDLLKEYRKGVKPGMLIIREKATNKSKYDGIANAAEVTQTPGMVILYKDDADTAQGYVDADVINNKITRMTGVDARYGTVENGKCRNYAMATCKH